MDVEREVFRLRYRFDIWKVEEKEELGRKRFIL